jgi:hypothetical protein
LSGSWGRRRKQNAPDGATTGWAKAVKLLGFGQRAEPSSALDEGMPGAGCRDSAARLFLGEPPDAIKHVRWCERGRPQKSPPTRFAHLTHRDELDGYSSAVGR